MHKAKLVTSKNHDQTGSDQVCSRIYQWGLISTALVTGMGGLFRLLKLFELVFKLRKSYRKFRYTEIDQVASQEANGKCDAVISKKVKKYKNETK